MRKEIKNFIKKYVEEIENQNAALFIGAGFSKPSGYVDWKELLKGIAEELDLDINKENDLVSLAQYYSNKEGNRAFINKIISDNFSEEKESSENHRIIARLPIFTFWTTNYDSLIENSLKENYRNPDVKRKNADLSITHPNRDSIVYKMHGDKSSPEEAIILKEDYETYYRKYSPFVNALNGDLISKTFLFLGFSFSDPNINYILSRIRIEYDKNNVRQHYAIIKNVSKKDYEVESEFEYFRNKQSLFINDLLIRYHIKVILIDDYKEITDILKEIEKKLTLKNIFISGSATEYSPFSEEEAKKFISNLSKKLIKEKYNIVSGFGLGVGSEVIVGALEEIYMKDKKIDNKRLLLRPFPQGIQNEETRKKLWTQYRKDMISQAGISLFLFGNKKDEDGKIILANGMEEEYQISKQNKNIIIPIGITGYLAKKIYDELEKEHLEHYGEKKEKIIDLFKKLNIGTLNEELIENILKFLKIMTS